MRQHQVAEEEEEQGSRDQGWSLLLLSKREDLENAYDTMLPRWTSQGLSFCVWHGFAENHVIHLLPGALGNNTDSFLGEAVDKSIRGAMVDHVWMVSSDHMLMPFPL
jgi:hypothetical protein